MYKIYQFNWHCIKGHTINNVSQIQGTVDIFGQGFGKHTIVQLGIQAPEGTLFTINAGSINTSSQIEIGDTKIFELDFKDSNTYITSLHLEVPSYLISNDGKAKQNFDVIVDILYEE